MCSRHILGSCSNPKLLPLSFSFSSLLTSRHATEMIKEHKVIGVSTAELAAQGYCHTPGFSPGTHHQSGKKPESRESHRKGLRLEALVEGLWVAPKATGMEGARQEALSLIHCSCHTPAWAPQCLGPSFVVGATGHSGAYD